MLVALRIVSPSTRMMAISPIAKRCGSGATDDGSTEGAGAATIAGVLDGGAALKVHAGVIGDEADVLAAERGEFFGLEDVETRLNTANAASLGLCVLLGCDWEGRGDKADQQRQGQQ